MSATMLHFVARWASRICDPHGAEVAEAAAALGLSVHEVEIDDHTDEALRYGVVNVPAVVIEGMPESLLIGAFPTARLIERLSPFVLARPSDRWS